MANINEIAVLRRMMRGVAASFSLTALALSSICFADTDPVQQTSVAGRQTIDDNAPGWVWKGMSECADSQMLCGTGHAGVIGTSGAYAFNGTGVEVYCVAAPTLKVDGRIRKVGRLKVTIDGQDKGSTSVALPNTTYNCKAFSIAGLPSKSHVVEVSADGGVVVVDYIVVLQADPPVKAESSSDDSTQGKIPEGDYRLFPTISPSKCLDVEGIKQADGTQAMLYALNKGPNQTWHILPLGHGTYRLSPLNSPGSALTVLGPYYNKKGVPITGIWTYMSAPNQIWKITSSDGQQFRLSSASSPDLILGVEDGVGKDNNRIEVYKDMSLGAQMWWIVPASQN